MTTPVETTLRPPTRGPGTGFGWPSGLAVVCLGTAVAARLAATGSPWRVEDWRHHAQGASWTWLAWADGGRPDQAELWTPVYPLLVRAARWVTGDLVGGAVLVTAVALGTTVCLLWARWMQSQRSVEEARWALVATVAFPGAYVLIGAVNPTGVAVAATAAALLALRRRTWLLAGAAAGVAVLTDPMGLAAVAAVVVGAWSGSREHPRRAVGVALPAVAPALGGVALMWIGSWYLGAPWWGPLSGAGGSGPHTVDRRWLVELAWPPYGGATWLEVVEWVGFVVTVALAARLRRHLAPEEQALVAAALLLAALGTSGTNGILRRSVLAFPVAARLGIELARSRHRSPAAFRLGILAIGASALTAAAAVGAYAGGGLDGGW